MRAKGFDGWMELRGNVVVIHPYFRGAEEKSVPLTGISALRLRPAGWFSNGFMEVQTHHGADRSGWGRSKDGVNRVGFRWSQRKAFTALRDAINAAMEAGPSGVAISTADELEKLARLKADGTISDHEFQRLKQRLISA